MYSWAERVHRRAADLSSVVTLCGHPGSSAPAYPYRLEKVKFGVLLEEVCKNNDNIPGPLLVLILKLNKESPNKRDVFRAPGHQGAMKKLIHFLQAGRLVNVDNYSVYTIASVLKKFLRKIPCGIFGRSGEEELFAIIELEDEAEQTERLYRLFTSLPKYTQHLLVLLFGTFRVIASNAVHAGTGMTSEALGVSVAPSFFQSCVSDGKTARMEDVLKFKIATKIVKHIIDRFALYDLFGRENYEYYARVTGRILKVHDEWICSFQYPPPPREKLAQQKYALQHSLEAEKTWLQCQCERWGLLAQEESRSTPALLTSSNSALGNSVISLGLTSEHSVLESCARLSVSLEEHSFFVLPTSPVSDGSKRNSLYGGLCDNDPATSGHSSFDKDNSNGNGTGNGNNNGNGNGNGNSQCNNDQRSTTNANANDMKHMPKWLPRSSDQTQANGSGSDPLTADHCDLINRGELGKMSLAKRRHCENRLRINKKLRNRIHGRLNSKSLDGCDKFQMVDSDRTVNKDTKLADIVLKLKEFQNIDNCHHRSRGSSVYFTTKSEVSILEKTAIKKLNYIGHEQWNAKSLTNLPDLDKFLLGSRISV